MSYGPIIIRKTPTGLELDYTGPLEHVPAELRVSGHNVPEGAAGHESVSVVVVDDGGEGWAALQTLLANASRHRDRR